MEITNSIHMAYPVFTQSITHLCVYPTSTSVSEYGWKGTKPRNVVPALGVGWGALRRFEDGTNMAIGRSRVTNALIRSAQATPGPWEMGSILTMVWGGGEVSGMTPWTDIACVGLVRQVYFPSQVEDMA